MVVTTEIIVFSDAQPYSLVGTLFGTNPLPKSWASERQKVTTVIVWCFAGRTWKNNSKWYIATTNTIIIIFILSRIRLLACSDFTVPISFLDVPHLF
jgi:hypothetical protein